MRLDADLAKGSASVSFMSASVSGRLMRNRVSGKLVFGQVKDSLLYVDWGGGEPFLRPDMCDILADAAAICPKANIDTRISLTVPLIFLTQQYQTRNLTILAQQTPY